MSSTIAQIPRYVTRWFEELQPLGINEAVPDPSRAAVFSADMIGGFLSKGNLASERLGRLARPVTQIFGSAYRHGVRQFVLFQDTHHPQAPEFRAFGLHGLQGTEESSAIPELQSLPFSPSFTIFKKNSLHPSLGTGFDKWLDQHPQVNTAIVVGVCTDLCIYQIAMYLRLRANAFDYRDYQVIVPANAVDTYDLTEDAARRSGSYAHPADFYHQVFLYHMALNDIRVVRQLT